MTDEPTFRPFLAEPGETLLAPLAPHDVAMRFARFCDATGLSTDDVVCSASSTIPLPLYPSAWPDGLRFWAGIDPSVMWHPIFWLPPYLARRAMVDDGIGAVPETDELWAARVMVELTRNGLYREHDGTWVDVLALSGLDVADAGVRGRIRSWIEGGDDTDLDAIDLSSLFTDVDVAWSVTTAWEAVQVLRPVRLVLHAESLGKDLRDVVDDDEDVPDTEHVAQVATTIAKLSAFCFQDLDDPAMSRWFDQCMSTWDGDCDTLLDQVVPDMLKRLDRVRDDNLDEASHVAGVGAQVSSDLTAPSVTNELADQSLAADPWAQTWDTTPPAPTT